MTKKRHKTRDRRFQKTESLIQQTIEREQLLFKPTEVRTTKFCQEARISRATFYRHYANYRQAVATYQRRTEQEVQQLFKERVEKRNSLETNFCLILDHIRVRQAVFRAALRAKNYACFKECLRSVRRLLAREWRRTHPQMTETLIRQLGIVFTFDFLRELEFWSELENFRAERSMVHARRLARLARRLPGRRYDPILPLTAQ